MRRVWKWTATDALACLYERTYRQAADDHYRATVLWALLAPHLKKEERKPAPEEPKILRNRR